MPFIKPKKSKPEAEDKDSKPSLVTAFNLQRRKKGKKMADGGKVDHDDIHDAADQELESIEDEISQKQKASPTGYADGGEIKTLGDEIGYPKAEGGQIKDYHDGIADAVMAKRKKAKMMAEGGLAGAEGSTDSNDFEMPAGEPFRELDEEAVKKELYGEMNFQSAADRVRAKRRK